MRLFRVLLCVLLLPAATVAQEAEVTVITARGATEDRPYTLFYPDTMQIVEDGSDVTVATLEYPGAPLQCDAMIAEGGAADWSAATAATSLDRAATEAGWTDQFPGFTISEVTTVDFQSGPALFYRATSQNSPLGVAATIFHAETVDAGRTYIYECLADSRLGADAEGLVDFLFANFSTKSDGKCCIDPAARVE